MLAMHKKSTSSTTNAAQSSKMHLKNTLMTTSLYRPMPTAKIQQNEPFKLGKNTLEQVLPLVMPTSQYLNETAWASKKISPLISYDRLTNTPLSAYACLYGNFNFNCTQIAPPGTKVLAHETPQQRASYVSHGQHGFYIGPSMHH